MWREARMEMRGVGGEYRRDPGADPVAASFDLTRTHLHIKRPWGSTPGAGPDRAVSLDEIVELHELAPFSEDPTAVEFHLRSGDVFRATLPRYVVDALCGALAATLDESAHRSPTEQSRAGHPPTGVTSPRRHGRRQRRSRPRHVLAMASLALSCIACATVWRTGDLDQASAHGRDRAGTTTTGSTSSSTTTGPPSTTTTTTTTVAPTTAAPTTTTTAPPPPPVAMGIAPLTGLPVEAWRVIRPAIVSKIDATPLAMPQRGLDQADIVLEVQIEYGYSRYLAVWHSQDPEVIGPHRSARTTDPNLLAMFGHPLFAFSGGNPKVMDLLTRIPWKTDATPGWVPHGYFRDESRPYPNNLFARPQALRERPTPPVWPGPQFVYRPPGQPPAGIPVRTFETAAGPIVGFTWDAAIGGWRRSIYGGEHLHPDGRPVAPANVVVLETAYRESFADAISPEAISIGGGRAWVFSAGHITGGTWIRLQPDAPYALRDATGAPLQLTPGSTWVVLAGPGHEPRVLG